MVGTRPCQAAVLLAAGWLSLGGPSARIVHADDPAARGSESPGAAASPAAPASPAEDRYEWREDHDPNGTGKFYLDREIALVMGHQAMLWLERPEREEEERLTLLIESLQLQPGMVVADVGAGSGVISRMMAREVGAEGVVLAIDIQQEMLDALTARSRLQGIRNIQAVLGTVDSPQLNPESVDLVVMVDVYHEFEFPYEMLQEISRALRPGGRVAFVEYRLEDPEVPIKLVHKMTEAQVKREALLPEFGLEWVETCDKLPRQHVIFFRKQPAEAETQPAGPDERPGDGPAESALLPSR